MSNLTWSKEGDAPPEPKPGEVIDRLARGKLVQAAYEKSLSEHRDDGHQYSWFSYMADAQDAWCDAADALVSCVIAELTRLQAHVAELEAREPKGLVRLTSADGADSEQEWHAFPSIEQMDAFAEQDHPRARVDDYLVSAWTWHPKS